MSKLTHKCPNCGATMPVDVKYCRKCHAKMDSGRVEVLSTPAKEQHPQKQSKKKDALRNLPKPVRPVEDEATAETAPAPEEQAPVREEGGYFSPDAREQTDAASGRGGAAVRRERRAPYGSDVPRPVSTARGAGAQAAPDRNRDRNLWQIITVLAIILVIIVVAILLVIRLNQPANGASDPYEGSNSAAVGTAEPSATPGTPGEDAEHAPEGLIVPTATPAATPTPTPVPTPTATPIPAATATPMPSPTAAATNGNYSVTPTNDTVYINGNGVNIRSGPGTNYQAIGSENTGKQLQRTGRTSNGWSQVAYNGQTAYVIDSLLTTTQPSSGTGTGTSTGATSGVTAASGTVKVTEPLGANLRSGPGTNYSIVATVAMNTELTRTGTSGGWTVVSYNGQNVYISSNLVTDSSSGTSTGTSTGTNTGTTTGVTAASGTLTVTGNSVNIRSGPGTNYSRIGSVNSGNTLTITGTSGNWYQVSYNGQTGYIISDYVTKN